MSQEPDRFEWDEDDITIEPPPEDFEDDGEDWDEDDDEDD